MHMISQNSGPKRHWDNQALYEKEYGNKRIRRSESDGETSSSKPCYDIPYKNISLYMAQPGYSPWLLLPPPVSKGRKSSSSTPGAENHITQCRSDRAWQMLNSSLLYFRCKASFFAREELCNGSYDRNSLPSGWLDCPPYGDAVKFIIPSKVPLRESFNDKIVIDKRYSPQQAILQQRRLGRELGLVIDLTNTDRYYRESDWTTREASGLQDNGFQENQVKNVVGAGEMANAVGEDEMENVTVPREMTNDDILGYAVPLNKMESMRQFCNKVLKPKSQGLFPGSHPVSLSRDNLRLLRQQYL
ncbi:mRNA-capping enzyme-like protein isoform X2 [Tanacetum coccineum]